MQAYQLKEIQASKSRAIGSQVQRSAGGDSGDPFWQLRRGIRGFQRNINESDEATTGKASEKMNFNLLESNPSSSLIQLFRVTLNPNIKISTYNDVQNYLGGPDISSPQLDEETINWLRYAFKHNFLYPFKNFEDLVNHAHRAVQYEMLLKELYSQGREMGKVSVRLHSESNGGGDSFTQKGLIVISINEIKKADLELFNGTQIHIHYKARPKLRERGDIEFAKKDEEAVAHIGLPLDRYIINHHAHKLLNEVVGGEELGDFFGLHKTRDNSGRVVGFLNFRGG